MNNPIQRILAAKGIVILDGAMATELEAKGCDLNHALWSAVVLKEQPELIEQVHYEYYKAGADCGISASYQATIAGFVKAGYTVKESEDLIRASVEIMKRAAQRYREESGVARELLVAGSVGPYGAYLADGSEYRGHYEIGYEELKDFHRRRMELLKEAGADILAIETVPCLVEAKAAVAVAAELDMPCWVSFSCRNETEISDGTRLAECAEWLKDKEHVAAIGLNCTAPEYVTGLIKEVKRVCQEEKPVIVYPNSGEEYDPVEKVWHGAKDGKSYGERAHEWYAAGAAIIGGCCRTTPAHIKEIAALDKK